MALQCSLYLVHAIFPHQGSKSFFRLATPISPFTTSSLIHVFTSSNPGSNTKNHSASTVSGTNPIAIVCKASSLSRKFDQASAYNALQGPSSGSRKTNRSTDVITVQTCDSARRYGPIAVVRLSSWASFLTMLNTSPEKRRASLWPAHFAGPFRY